MNMLSACVGCTVLKRTGQGPSTSAMSKMLRSGCSSERFTSTYSVRRVHVSSGVRGQTSSGLLLVASTSAGIGGRTPGPPFASLSVPAVASMASRSSSASRRRRRKRESSSLGASFASALAVGMLDIRYAALFMMTRCIALMLQPLAGICAASQSRSCGSVGASPSLPRSFDVGHRPMPK